MRLDEIKVEMLGGFAVWSNGEQLVEESAKMTKPWQLFCYLVLHREKYVPSHRLMATLWPDDSLSDPANVLKNAVYTLRKDLCGGKGYDEDTVPILYSTGGYRLDPAIKLDLDIDTFAGLCQKVAQEPDDSPAKEKLCRQAVDFYRGDFLPQMEQELWTVPFVLEYRRKYLEVVAQYCALLWKKEEYKKVLEIASAANVQEPADEKALVYMFRAMEALRMYRVIVTTYSKTAQYFADSVGTTEPEEVRRIYNSATERINKAEQDIIVIKTEMAAAEQEDRPSRGAYYCPYSHMKQTFPILKRATERGQQSLILALFTLLPEKGATVNAYDMTRAMAEFKVVAMNNLRKSDVLSQYSKNQYVMLLVVASLEDGRIVRDRIQEKYNAIPISRQINLDIKLTEV